MAESVAEAIRVIGTDGTWAPTPAAEEYVEAAEAVETETLVDFLGDMVRARTFDVEAVNLQRQGRLALWVPCYGQEAAQVGSGHAARSQDTIFPAYREHAVAMIRGVQLIDIVRMMRGETHGGWIPEEHGNFHLYTLVIGSQTLHATGYAMGIQLDGATATGDPERDEAVMVYFGDGATSQGDTNEALVFAASYQTPQVFLLQNNHWAISVPVERQSRTPLYRRAAGFGMPGVQVDGNDVLAMYTVTRSLLDAARAGRGPALVEALTYRIGAHTSADDPTRYRDDDDLAEWTARDPLVRMRTFLESRGVGEEVFRRLDEAARDAAADVRRRLPDLTDPAAESMFAHVYSDPHPLMQAQAAWLAEYEASFGEPG